MERLHQECDHLARIRSSVRFEVLPRMFCILRKGIAGCVGQNALVDVNVSLTWKARSMEGQFGGIPYRKTEGSQQFQQSTVMFSALAIAPIINTQEAARSCGDLLNQ